MRKFLPILFVAGLLSVNTVYADSYYSITSSVQQFSVTPFRQCSCNKKSCKSFTDEIILERAVISNALQLTEEQAKFRQKILHDDFSIMEENFAKLHQEEIRLKQLKTQNADKTVIKAQQKVVKNIKKEIKNIIKKENKEYKKVLTSEQCAKLREIQKLQQKSIKDSEKQKDYYKLNPKMRQFAPHLVQ